MLTDIVDFHTGTGENVSAGGSGLSGSGVPPPVQLDWLKGPFLQNALCQVFQRFALEGDEVNRTLVHKVCTGSGYIFMFWWPLDRHKVSTMTL